jgi:hypothetical protein
MFIRKPDNSNGSADKMYSDLVVFSRIMSFECITVNNRLIFFFFFYISERQNEYFSKKHDSSSILASFAYKKKRVFVS